LKKCYEFVWDETSNKAFKFSKLALTCTPLLFPPNYSRDYFLYLTVVDSTIAMVLFQEEDSHDEHVIYYLSRGLTTTEAKYLHVEKLVLAVVQVVQHFCHYILLRRTNLRLQPYAAYPYVAIARGKSLQKDSDSPGV
jgi:hypothetical protein